MYYKLRELRGLGVDLRKVFFVMLFFLFSLSLTINVSGFSFEDIAKEVNVNISVNGTMLSPERQPVNIDGRTLVPARSSLKNLEAKVDWYEDKNLVVVSKEDIVISMNIGEKIAKVNNVSKDMEVPAILIRGTVMIPLRFVAENLGAKVSWDGTLKAISIADKSSNENISRGELRGNYTVVIDAGHGGIEPGAVYNGVNEKDLNLEIALKLNELLKSEGITTYMTRTGDYYVSLKDRYNYANSLNADLFISVHNNVSPNSWVSGTETLYFPTSNTSGNMNGEKLAYIIQNELTDSLGSKDLGTIPRSKLAVLRHTQMPAVIAEIGYMTSSSELKRLKSTSYQEKIAESLKNGIVKALKMKE